MCASNVIQFLILIVLSLTLGAIWCYTKAQKRLSASQLLRDRYEMFFSAWDVTEEDVRQFKEKRHLFTEGMDNSTYENYQTNEAAIRDYLLIVQLYEYLAFAHTLNTDPEYLGHESKPDDPYGEEWVRRWVEILIEDDEDFPHVQKSYEKDHHRFHKFVENLVKNAPIVRAPRFSDTAGTK